MQFRHPRLYVIGVVAAMAVATGCPGPTEPTGDKSPKPKTTATPKGGASASASPGASPSGSASPSTKPSAGTSTPSPKPTTTSTPAVTTTTKPSTPASPQASASASSGPPATPSPSPSPTPAPITAFTAFMDGQQVRPLAITTDAAAAVAATLSTDETLLKLKLHVVGLSGAVSHCKIFRGDAEAVGELVKDLAFTGPGKTFTFEWKSTDADKALTPALVADLRGNKLYINLDTAANVDGEVRGQLEATGVAAAGVVDAAQEEPVGTSAAEGVVAVHLNREGSLMTINAQVTAAKLNGGKVEVAHIHNGAPKVNGPQVKTVPFDLKGRATTTTWKKIDNTEPLGQGLIDAFGAGNLYLNVHTTASMAPEIRGQITKP